MLCSFSSLHDELKIQIYSVENEEGKECRLNQDCNANVVLFFSLGKMKRLQFVLKKLKEEEEKGNATVI